MIWIQEGKFNKLNAEEIKSLSDEDLILYSDAKSENSLKGINDTIKGLMSKDDFETFKKELADKDTDAKFKAYDEAFVKLQKQIKDNVKDVTPDNFKAFTDAHSKFRTGVKFALKANALRSTVANSTQAYRLPDVSRLASPKMAISDFFSVINLPADNNGTVRYIDWDVTSVTRSAAAIAEGAVFPESTADFAEYSLSLEKVGDTIPVSEEFVNDVNFARAELEYFLQNNVSRIENAYLYSGTGTTPQVSGIYTRTTAFNAGAYSGKTTTTPNLFNLIDVLANEIENTGGGKYDVNFCFVPNAELLALKLLKDTTGRPLYDIDALTSGKIKIIGDSNVTTNTMVIGDGNFAKIYQNEAYNMQVGLDGNDFTYDLMTLKAKRRMALLIREADLTGFLKVTSISAALTAITT